MVGSYLAVRAPFGTPAYTLGRAGGSAAGRRSLPPPGVSSGSGGAGREARATPLAPAAWAPGRGLPCTRHAPPGTVLTVPQGRRYLDPAEGRPFPRPPVLSRPAHHSLSAHAEQGRGVMENATRPRWVPVRPQSAEVPELGQWRVGLLLTRRAWASPARPGCRWSRGWPGRWCRRPRGPRGCSRGTGSLAARRSPWPPCR